jgi:hypothetical protein
MLLVASFLIFVCIMVSVLILFTFKLNDEAEWNQICIVILVCRKSLAKILHTLYKILLMTWCASKIAASYLYLYNHRSLSIILHFYLICHYFFILPHLPINLCRRRRYRIANSMPSMRDCSPREVSTSSSASAH